MNIQSAKEMLNRIELCYAEAMVRFGDRLSPKQQDAINKAMVGAINAGLNNVFKVLEYSLRLCCDQVIQENNPS